VVRIQKPKLGDDRESSRSQRASPRAALPPGRGNLWRRQDAHLVGEREQDFLVARGKNNNTSHSERIRGGAPAYKEDGLEGGPSTLRE